MKKHGKRLKQNPPEQPAEAVSASRQEAEEDFARHLALLFQAELGEQEKATADASPDAGASDVTAQDAPVQQDEPIDMRSLNRAVHSLLQNAEPDRDAEPPEPAEPEPEQPAQETSEPETVRLDLDFALQDGGAEPEAPSAAPADEAAAPELPTPAAEPADEAAAPELPIAEAAAAEIAAAEAEKLSRKALRAEPDAPTGTPDGRPAGRRLQRGQSSTTISTTFSTASRSSLPF